MAAIGREFSSNDVTVHLNGIKVATAQEVKFKVSTETEDIYVLGSADPAAFGIGKNSYEGSLTLLMSELMQLIESATAQNKMLSRTPVTLVMVIEADGYIKTATAENCRLTEYEFGSKEGDMFTPISIPVKTTSIKIQ